MLANTNMQVKRLTESEVAELWEHLGGDQTYAEIRLSKLLCRYRSSILVGSEDVRLRAFLAEHWTLEGPCFDERRFPKAGFKCPREVREQHKTFYVLL
jgi:hypothetical protein